MPRGDGTGPGKGGRGRGQGRGAGVPANCVCPQCGHIQAHQRGKPCTKTACPNCGAMMVRQ